MIIVIYIYIYRLLYTISPYLYLKIGVLDRAFGSESSFGLLAELLHSLIYYRKPKGRLSLACLLCSPFLRFPILQVDPREPSGDRNNDTYEILNVMVWGGLPCNL